MDPSVIVVLMNKLYFNLLTGMLSAILLTTACHREDKEPVLAYFGSSPTILSPIDSISLDRYGILMPSGINKYGNWLIITKGLADNIVDLVNIDDGNVIECFRKGRGPGEVLMGSKTQLIGSSLYVYDISQMKYHRLDIDATIEKGEQQSVLECQFKTNKDDVTTMNRPFIPYKIGSSILSTGIFNSCKWFGVLSDDGAISSGVDYEVYDSMKDLTNQQLAAIHLSSFFSCNPEGKYVVVAMKQCPVISICSFSDRQLSEKVRLVFDDVDVRGGQKKYEPVVVSGNNAKTAFCEVQSDKDRVLLLYSGRKLSDSSTPSYECNYILESDWRGTPKGYYILSRSINSFHLIGRKIYGVSSSPEPMLYVYELSDKN